MNTNWFLHQGLLRHGETRYAAQLADTRMSWSSAAASTSSTTHVLASGWCPSLGWATLAADMDI